MTEDDEEEDDDRRSIFSDPMFTVRRHEGPAREPSKEDGPTFRDTLASRLFQLDQYFVDMDWPPFSGLVFVNPSDDKFWSAVPRDWETHWAAEGLDPRLETFETAPHRIERDIHFISRRVELLSPEYWLICEAMRMALLCNS